MKPRKVLDFVERDGCFICTSHCVGLQGYPIVRRQRGLNTVARFIYEECFGFISKGLLLRHTCDNKLCINPEHLVLGTYQDNVDDMEERGRANHVSQKGWRKLPDDVVRTIRSRNESIFESVKKYGLSKNTIGRIRIRKTYREVL